MSVQLTEPIAIPVKFFTDCNTLGFWNTDVKRYGQWATHLQPRTFAVGWRCDGNLEETDYTDSHDPLGPLSLDADNFLMNSLTMTREQMDTQARRVRARRVRNAALSNEIRFTRRVRRLRPLPRPRPLPPYVEPEYRPPITNDIFNKIRNYLIRMKDRLVLPTLHFEITEHLLLSYIRAEGYPLSASRWRSFLQRCNQRQELFMYVPTSPLYSYLHSPNALLTLPQMDGNRLSASRNTWHRPPPHNRIARLAVRIL